MQTFRLDLRADAPIFERMSNMNFVPDKEPRASLWFAKLFRMFAVRNGFEENDPLFVRALEALGKVKQGELSSAEADATLDPLFEALKTRELPNFGAKSKRN